MLSLFAEAYSADWTARFRRDLCLRRQRYFFGADCRDAIEAAKIFHTESEDMRHPVHHHGGDQPGIVAFLSRYSVARHELAPLAVNCIVFAKP